MTAAMINIAFGCLIAAILLGSARRLLSRPSLDFLSIISMGLGWIALTVHLAMRWSAVGFASMINPFESLVFLAWLILIVFFALSSRWSVPSLGVWTALASLLFLIISGLQSHA